MIVLWTWPAGCEVYQSVGNGQPKRRFQLRRVKARGVLGVSCRLAQRRRLSDSCLKAVNGQDDARLMHSSHW